MFIDHDIASSDFGFEIQETVSTWFRMINVLINILFPPITVVYYNITKLNKSATAH